MKGDEVARTKGASTVETGTNVLDEPVVAPVRSRRSAMWLAAGVVLILLGAIAGYFIYTSASKSTQVFVAATDITRGDTITQASLTTLAIASGQPTSGISANEIDEVLGQIATTDLPAGSLITDAAIDEVLDGADGQATVGLLLSPQQMPTQQLVAGDEVLLVPIKPHTASDQVAPEPIPATVSIVRATREDGKVRLDVFVSPQAAAAVATNAAADTLALYLAPKK